MVDMVLPTVGSSGYFALRAPLDTLIVQNERYTCQAIRRISDYVAANEKPFELIYDKYKLTEEEWKNDQASNMYIVSLQSDKGHWLYVPASYILTFPIPNGIPYRAISLVVALPSIPADTDLSFIEQDIRNIIKDSIGVNCNIKPIETSRVVLFTKENHDIIKAERDILASGRGTDRARYKDTQQQLDIALGKIVALEKYIIDNGL